MKIESLFFDKTRWNQMHEQGKLVQMEVVPKTMLEHITTSQS